MLEYVMWGGEGEGRVMRERVHTKRQTGKGVTVWSVVSGQWSDLVSGLV